MATLNYNPNARYDNGPNAAGSERVSTEAVLFSASAKGLADDGALSSANSRVGFSAAGVTRNNGGPNVAGAPKSYNNT